jgi:hypothetical protein
MQEKVLFFLKGLGMNIFFEFIAHFICVCHFFLLPLHTILCKIYNSKYNTIIQSINFNTDKSK